MQAPESYTLLRERIKTTLKSQGLTYKDLARELSLSESGVKKLLGGNDISFSRLAQICAALDLSVGDLLQTESEPGAPPIEFDRETQDYFLKNRAAFNLFFLILTEPKSLKELIEEYGFTKASAYKILRELDRRGLVKWKSDDRITSNVKPALFKTGAPFIEKILREWTHELIDGLLAGKPGDRDVFFTARLFYFLPETRQAFHTAIGDLVKEFAMRSVREKKQFGRQTKPVRFIVGLRPGHFVKAQPTDR